MASNLRSDKSVVKWYLRPVAIVIAVLAVGPFAIPLIWISPALRRWHKITATILVVLMTVWMAMALSDLFKLLSEEMRNLQAILK